MKKYTISFLIIIVILLSEVKDVYGRRGRTRGRTKSRAAAHSRCRVLHRGDTGRMKKYTISFLIIIVILLSEVKDVYGRRGRTRGRTKSRAQIGLPITGKYRDPDSDKYYNNNDGAKILEASHFDFEYVLGHKIVFVCVAKGSPRPQITWFKDGVELYAHSYVHVHEWCFGPDKIKSKLEIDPATQMDAGVYECSADNMYSVDRRSFKTDFSIAFD